MRASLFGLMLSLLVAVPLQAQPAKDKAKPAATSRTILASLQHEVKSDTFTGPMKFSEFLTMANESLAAVNKDVRFVVDDEAFREERNDAPDMLDQEIRLRGVTGKVSVNHLLRQALRQLPVKAAFVVRGGKIEILPYARTSKEFMLNQTFHVDFNERRLDQAIEELSELTGVSIVIDGRARQKAQTLITARFHDDVALQDAVRMLADMAELKLVYLVTGLYVTTPDHAPVLQKELWKAYGFPEPVPALPPNPLNPLGPLDPMLGTPPIDTSPLTPPLPPTRKRLEAAA